MNNKDLISVIVPVYNSEKYVSVCIESILNQTYSNIELLLVDNNSKDNSIEICNKYKEKDNRIRLLHENKQGVSNARNKGIESSKGKYILFVDSDDFISNNFIEELVKFSNKDTITRGYSFTDNVKYVSIEYIKKILYLRTLGTCCGYLINREKCKDILFDTNTRYMEDTQYIVKIISMYDDVCELKDIKYEYVINERSATHSINNMISIIEQYFYSIDDIVKTAKNIGIDVNDSIIRKRKYKILKGNLYKLRNFNELKNYTSSNKFYKIMVSCNEKYRNGFNLNIYIFFLYLRYFIKYKILKK